MNIIGSNNIFTNYIKTLVNDKYNIRSGYAYYDSITHYYLGRYLREYKTDKNIDLTSMYNCYSSNMISNYRISTTHYIDGNGVLNYQGVLNGISSDNAYDLVFIQVMPKDLFTLCFESDLPIVVGVASYNGISFIDGRIDNLKYFSRTRTREPVTYEVPDYDVNQKDNAYRVDNLVLLIQIPKRCTKRIILIGDHTDLSEHINTFEGNNTDNRVLSNIEAFYQEGRSVAFLDELIPYLLGYVITEHDEIYQNILRIQKLMSSYTLSKTYKDQYRLDYTEGDLDSNMITWLKEFQKKHISKYNDTGRVNKDIEELLIRGGSVDA